MSAPFAAAANLFSATGDRLYQRLAHILFEQLSSGRYAIGDRLPAERELSVEYNVSRPAVREALIALEVQGFVEVRIGSVRSSSDCRATARIDPGSP